MTEIFDFAYEVEAHFGLHREIATETRYAPSGKAYDTFSAGGIKPEGAAPPAYATSPEWAKKLFIFGIEQHYGADLKDRKIFWRRMPEISEYKREEGLEITLYHIAARLVIE